MRNDENMISSTWEALVILDNSLKKMDSKTFTNRLDKLQLRSAYQILRRDHIMLTKGYCAGYHTGLRSKT